MQIGEVIRTYRKKQNLTQEEMANRLGVSAPAVNKWGNGFIAPRHLHAGACRPPSGDHP